jgi:hypothetical protein
MSNKGTFIPQSKEVAKDTKMPAYEYQRGCSSTLTMIYEQKSAGEKAAPNQECAVLSALKV